jgi:hypothetical protein
VDESGGVSDYRQFVIEGALEGSIEGIWERIKGQTVLCDEEFVQSIMAEARGNPVE